MTDEEEVVELSADEDTSPAQQIEPVKKRPGRPRKAPPRQPKPKNGIVSEPSDSRHVIEFLYDKPLIFKKLWQYFKLMAVDKIRMNFTRESIIMLCTDHHKKNRMRISIDCNEVNHYYCKEELDTNMACMNLSLIMAMVDKNYSSLLMLSTVESVQKNIQIIFKNDLDLEESHKVELIGEYGEVENERLYLDNDYTLKFTLPGKYFKKMISDISTISDQITIRQDGVGEPLMFEYVKSDKKVKSLYTARNNRAINLQSSLKEGETFHTSFKIDYVKPISSALLAETVEIYADEKKPLKFIIYMDNSTVQMQILTEIIDNRGV